VAGTIKDAGMRRRKPISFSAAQGFENVEQRAINLPEKGLWCEVLLEALADLRRNRYRRPAMAWIKSNGQGVGSFCWICHCLNLDCGAVRGTLSRDNKMFSRRFRVPGK
jgi:hypothetical protein